MVGVVGLVKGGRVWYEVVGGGRSGRSGKGGRDNRSSSRGW